MAGLQNSSNNKNYTIMGNIVSGPVHVQAQLKDQALTHPLCWVADIDKSAPLYCCILVHGVKDRPRESEAAFLQWKDQVLTHPLCWVADTDKSGIPRFYIVALVYVRPPAGFLDQTYTEVCTHMGIDESAIGSLHECYFTWSQLFLHGVSVIPTGMPGYTGIDGKQETGTSVRGNELL